MQNLYDYIQSLDILLILSLAIAILLIDIFIIGSSALLLISISLFIFSGITYFIDSGFLLTWSIPAILLVLFLLQRQILNLISFQKLPHEEKRSGSYKAIVKLSEDPDASHDYFYGYKDEKQAVSSESTGDGLRYVALLTDGRTYLLDKDSKLFDGQRVKISISKNETVKVIKYYE